MTTLYPRQTFANSIEPEWVPVTLTAGDNVVFPGIVGEQVKVYAVFLSAASLVYVTFSSGPSVGGKPFSGSMPMTSLAFDTETVPMICRDGDDFVINSTGAAAGMVMLIQN